MASTKVHIKKWGNSASVRMPAPLMTAAALSLDQMVELREENGRRVIDPFQRRLYRWTLSSTR